MSEEHRKQLESKLWDIANTLRGKMGADEFRDYILGFIFYKYLSEKMHLYANSLIENEDIKEFTELSTNIFFGTGIPTCILVHEKQRGENAENILFISTSGDDHFEKVA